MLSPCTCVKVQGGVSQCGCQKTDSLISSLLVTQMLILYAHLWVCKNILDLVCKKCVVYVPENVSYS